MSAESFTVKGADAPITIDVDTWGVPHIRAASAEDAFFGQGFVVARARLFQLDWWRRKGLGQVAAVLGPSYVERDAAARQYLFRGDMRAEWLAYGVRTRGAVSAFTAGINAWIRCTAEDPSLLPPEFTALDYRPALWRPEDVVRIRTHGLYANVEEEVARAITLRDFGAGVENLRRHREPELELQVPEGLDLHLITDEVLASYRRAFAPVEPAAARSDEMDGSNNWVVGPSRTATGRPILANDPHRAMATPSLRHIVHLTCPQFDVIGAGEPALPGVSIGHNGSVAFGLTVWNVDLEDLYVYELHPSDHALYRHRDSWVRMTEITEQIEVRGLPPQEVTLSYTVHGPVTYVDHDRHAAFALRAAWLEPGAAPYLNSISTMVAADAPEFRQELDRWSTPGLNHVYADTTGRFGWSPRALVPIRPNWDGLLPVPGDGRFEWAGFRVSDELPEDLDNRRGWVASANEMNLPPTVDSSTQPVSYEWFAKTRADRINSVLAAEPQMTVARSALLQNDYLNPVAVQIIERIASLPLTDNTAESARAILTDWDGEMDHRSAGALLFETWVRGPLRSALYKDAIASLVPTSDHERAVAAALPTEPHFGDLTVTLRLFMKLAERERALVDVVSVTLAEAVKTVTQRHGDEPHRWAWGMRNVTQFMHMAAALLPPEFAGAQLHPRPKSGSSETVGLAAASPDTGAQVTGASFRVVIDVGDWDNSIAVNAPGQSGDPRDPHYADLVALWIRDGYFPLCYSPAAIAAHRERTYTLLPEG